MSAGAWIHGDVPRTQVYTVIDVVQEKNIVGYLMVLTCPPAVVFFLPLGLRHVLSYLQCQLAFISAVPAA